ncbi:hypothetical protein HPB47_007398 [Ixodes persulcatus]|uniref:Uncharacterized protein n=1 Tax=Ixodes persulcatus TaxID=34615 RepID=A0AC60P806_IXOPE|nr:hypothetical protein HPB47_007398 [Ixodes persulcatus]
MDSALAPVALTTLLEQAQFHSSACDVGSVAVTRTSSAAVDPCFRIVWNAASVCRARRVYAGDESIAAHGSVVERAALLAHTPLRNRGAARGAPSTVWSPAPGVFPVHGNRPGYVFRATLSTLESSRLHRSVHSIAGSEDKDSPMNPAEDITPGQQCATTSSRQVIVPTSDIELSDFDEPDWKDVKTRKKRKKTSPNSSLSAETVWSAGVVPEGLTVVFTPLEEGHVITSLSSLKLSLALEKMFPECILEIRFNNRLNLIAVDVRNGQTTRGLLRCTVLCGIKVRAYEPLPRHCATGVIRDVDTTLTDEEIANNLRSPENRAKVQRSRSPSADRRCQATFTSVMSGMQFHNSKRIHFNAASVAAMDIERQPASAARCANAAAARMRTETPALLKKNALTAATHTRLHHHPVQNGGRKKRQKITPDNTESISGLPELQFMNPDGRSCPEKAKGLLQLRRTLRLP